MAGTLVQENSDNAVINRIAQLEETVLEMRSNQLQKITYGNFTIDGTGNPTTVYVNNSLGIVWQFQQNNIPGFRFFNNLGYQNGRIFVDASGFIKAEFNSYYFPTNPENRLRESFGVQVKNDDTAAVYAFQVVDLNLALCWQFDSAGNAKQGKSGFLTMQGGHADPGGQGTHTVALYENVTGMGNDSYKAEFNTGAAGIIIGGP